MLAPGRVQMLSRQSLPLQYKCACLQIKEMYQQWSSAKSQSHSCQDDYESHPAKKKLMVRNLVLKASFVVGSKNGKMRIRQPSTARSGFALQGTDPSRPLQMSENMGNTRRISSQQRAKHFGLRQRSTLTILTDRHSRRLQCKAC